MSVVGLGCNNFGGRIDLQRTRAALDELVAEGKLRCAGHSNLSGWQLADAAHKSAARTR